MRNAALVLGLIGGLFARRVGRFNYGYVAFMQWFGEVPDLARQVANPELVQAASFVAPLVGIAGAAMARARALWGGLLMLAAAAGFYAGVGFDVFSMFPIAALGLGGVLAIAAGRPDEERAHF